MDEMSLPHSPLCTLITTYISHLSGTKEMEFLQNYNDFHSQRRPHSSTFSGVKSWPSICSPVGFSPGWRLGPVAWPSCLTCGWSWNRGFKGWLCLVAPADYIKSSMCSNSSCSLNSENPYATIRDPPALACKHTENSYVEMKSPSHREVPFGGTATLLGGAGRNVYDVGECVVALVCGAQQGSVAFVPAAHVPPGEHTRAWP